MKPNENEMEVVTCLRYLEVVLSTDARMEYRFYRREKEFLGIGENMIRERGRKQCP